MRRGLAWLTMTMVPFLSSGQSTGGLPALQSDLSAEKTRAMAAESALAGGLSAEVAARMQGDADALAAAKAYADTSRCPRGTCSASGGPCRYDKHCPSGETCRDPIPRFTHGNGTVIDLRTCLMWEKKTGTPGSYADAIRCTSASVCPDPHNVNNLYLWATVTNEVATVFLQQLNDGAFAGYTDWRLPTSAGGGTHPTGEDPELESILLTPHPCVTSPCIDATVFGPTFADYYWSSSPCAPFFPGPAWYVSFTTGGVGTADYSYPNFARAVRNLP